MIIKYKITILSIVLGLKLVLLLVVTVFSSVIVSQVYADSIMINFDKSEFTTGDSLSIAGQISEFKMPIIAMSIYDPDGKILVANNVEIEPDGSFGKTILLNSPFYEKPGQYKIKFDYGKISQTEFFQVSNHDIPDEIIEKPSVPEITLLTTDKPGYTDNETINIRGSVSALDSPTVLIGIYDTFGTPAGFYFGNIDSNLEFSTSFLAKADVNFKLDGIYSIKAHYAKSSKTVSFEFSKIVEKTNTGDEIIDKPIDTQNETIDTQNDKPVPTLNDENDSERIDNTNTESQLDTDSKKNKPEITNTNNIPNDDSFTTHSQPKENETNNDKPVIQKTPQDKTNEDTKTINDNSIIQNPKPSIEKQPQKQSSDKIKKENNLTVEDIELGLILNQINLECDSSKYTDTISYYDGMGPALYRLCKFDISLNFFDDALAKDPDNVEILTNKGSTLGKLGLYSDSILYYNHALDIDPEFLPAVNNKANALSNLGKYDEAKLLYAYAIEKNPNYITARKNLSLLSSELPQENYVSLKQQPAIQKLDTTSDKNALVIIEKSQPSKTEKENQSDFFEEISLAFSSLGSLFGLFN